MAFCFNSRKTFGELLQLQHLVQLETIYGIMEGKKGTDAFKYEWPFPKNPTLLYKWKSRATMCFVYLSSKIMFPVLNKIRFENRSTLIKMLQDTSRPLITVSNHRCNIDDPLLWAGLSPSEFLRNIDRWRYILTAHNICFTKQWHTTMFSLGRCVPCVRGAGVFQDGVDECINALNRNGWVHVFPEGRVTRIPIRIKWGVGRLIAESKIAPVVLPIWIDGMDSVWPKRPPYYPLMGKTVHVKIGEPFDTSELRLMHSQSDELCRRKTLTDAVQDKLFELGCVTPRNPVEAEPPSSDTGICAK